MVLRKMHSEVNYMVTGVFPTNSKWFEKNALRS